LYTFGAAGARMLPTQDRLPLCLDPPCRLGDHVAMFILPGLTSTKKDRIPSFIEDLRDSEIRRIALFPTLLGMDERKALYRELETVAGLIIPHVHIRNDFTEAELDYLAGRFGTEAFNIHPRSSTHPFGPLPARFAARIFVENVDVPADDAELSGSGTGDPAPGGICPDFSHLENNRLHGRRLYVDAVMGQLKRFKAGCCHVSAVRVGVPNHWAGGWDHHEYSSLEDLSYLSAYREFLPDTWVSLELENGFAQQMEAKAWLESLLAQAPGAALSPSFPPSGR
jgi:hypothetical protein